MPHLWSGRFDEEPDASVFSYGVSLSFDRQLFEDDVTGSLAWAEALARAGVLSEADAAAIAGGLSEILETGRRDPAFVDGPDEDIHAFVERQLVERIGEAGKRLHTGRSRNEQVSLDLRLYLKRRIPLISRRLTRLVAALASQGRGLRRRRPCRRTRTCGGRSRFSRRTSSWRTRPPSGATSAASRARWTRPTRCPSARAPSPARPTPSTRAFLAERLGFSRTVVNSLDASSDRDFVASFLYACSLTMVHLSRLAEDVIIFTSEEFGFFELPDRFATGSSLMPQKKNPDPLELARGKSGRVLGPPRRAGW